MVSLVQSGLWSHNHGNTDITHMMQLDTPVPRVQLTRGFLSAPCKHSPTRMPTIIGVMMQLSL